MKKPILFSLASIFLLAGVFFGNTPPASGATIDTFLWGSVPGVYSNGDFTDAEKSGTSADNLLCWAAAAANVLAWGGWDDGVGNEDAIFGEFKNYWTNDGSWSRFGWEWWFTGNVGTAHSPDVAWNTLGLTGSEFDNTNATPSDSSDDFIPHFTLQQYSDSIRRWEILDDNPNLSAANQQIMSFIDDGYGTTLQLIRLDENGTSLGGHAVTLWGYKTIDGSLDGIWISDSDNTDNNIDYYTIYYTELYFPRWHIQNDYGNPNEYKYIGSLAGLLPNSNVNPDPNGGENGVVPEPGTILLLGFGLLGIAGVSRKKTILL